MAQSNLSTLLSTIRSLPPLPISINRLLALDQSHASYLERVSSIVRTDPALVAQIIKVANSSIYSGQDSVESLERAMLRVGVRTAVNALVSVHLQRAFKPQQEELTELWLSNLWSGIFCHAIAEKNRELDLVPETAFTFGLLHDVGRLVLVALDGQTQACAHITSSADDAILQAERESVLVDHALAGRLLGNQWKFPQDLVLVIAAHHDGPEALAEQPELVRKMVHLVSLSDQVGQIVRSPSSDPDELEARVAECLEEPTLLNSMDALALNRGDVLSVMGPSLNTLENHAKNMGISLEQTSTTLGG